MKQSEILVVFTGGTICSAPAQDGKNESDAKKTESYLIDDFKKSDSVFRDKVHFIPRHLKQDILSENMTINAWNELISVFKDESIWSKYKGIIVLHGTDTLAYTSSLLSILLSGAPIPICLVSAQLRLVNEVGVESNGQINTVYEKEHRSNGYANFRASVELIMNGIEPNVYVVYRNVSNENHDPGDLYAHYGSHLLQCPNYSNNFDSIDKIPISDVNNASAKGLRFETDTFLLNEITALNNDVAIIRPYTGLNYKNFNTKGIRAIIHGTYHSESVCIGRSKKQTSKKPKITLADIKKEDRPCSILSLLKRCKKRGIPVFLTPCNKKLYSYGSTRDALDNGASFIADTTLEFAYAKLVVGCALGKRGEDLILFANKTSINYDFPYSKEKQE